MIFTKTKLLTAFLAMSMFTSLGCGKKNKNQSKESPNQEETGDIKSDPSEVDNTNDPNDTKDEPKPSDQSGDLEVARIRRSVSIILTNGFVSHSHAIFIFGTNKDNVKVKSAKLDGVEIRKGTGQLGNADKYLTGIIDEKSLQEMTFDSEPEGDEAMKASILSAHKGQAFFYLEGFTYNLMRKDAVFRFAFELEAGGSTAICESVIDN